MIWKFKGLVVNRLFRMTREMSLKSQYFGSMTRQTLSMTFYHITCKFFLCLNWHRCDNREIFYSLEKQFSEVISADWVVETISVTLINIYVHNPILWPELAVNAVQIVLCPYVQEFIDLLCHRYKETIESLCNFHIIGYFLIIFN